jgi:hypothetical protein
VSIILEVGTHMATLLISRRRAPPGAPISHMVISLARALNLSQFSAVAMLMFILIGEHRRLWGRFIADAQMDGETLEN